MRAPTKQQIREAKAAVAHAVDARKQAEDAAVKASQEAAERNQHAARRISEHREALDRLAILTLTPTMLAAMVDLRDRKRTARRIPEASARRLRDLGLVDVWYRAGTFGGLERVTDNGLALLKERGL